MSELASREKGATQVMATGLDQPWPKYCGPSVCVKIKLANTLSHHILQQLNSSVEIGNFTIHFSSRTVPTPPQGASRVHANLSYLFKADILKGKILMTDNLLAMSFTVYHLLLLLFKFGWSSIRKESLKMYLEKYLSPLPVPCPLLPIFVIWLNNNPKLTKMKPKPSKLLFLHFVILTPFLGFPNGWQTFSTSDVGNTAYCHS